MVLAAPLTELVVEAMGVSLHNGRLQVRADGAESFAISGPYFHVNIAASEGVPSSAEVRLAGLRAQVSAVAGGADLTAAGSDTSYRVRAGYSGCFGWRRFPRPRGLQPGSGPSFASRPTSGDRPRFAGSCGGGFRPHLLE
jgi:hypothetical protein